MQILLINPPSTAPNPVMPLGLAYLAAMLERRKISVKIIDAWAEQYSFEDLARMVSKQVFDVAGITMMSPCYGAAMRTVDIVKQYSNAKIVVGGPHPTALPQECLADNPHIDFIVIGEGENTLTDLVQALRNGCKEYRHIKGLAFRHEGRIVNTGHSEPIGNLDDLPFPARHLFPLEKYQTHPPYGIRDPYLTLITSRGCPFRCTYCSKSVFGSKYRAYSPQRVAAEIRHMINEHGAREIHFYDDDFTMDKRRTEEICRQLRYANIKIPWSCTTRVDLVDEKLLKIMKSAGCWLISYGFESADPGILQSVRKGYGIDTIRKAFALTRETGIRTIAYFMAGLPGETGRTLQQTIDFSIRLKPDFVSWGTTALYPGSALYADAQQGLLGDIDIRYTGRECNWHASGSPYGTGYAIIHEESLSREALQEYVRKANRAFYLRPAYLMRLLFKIRSPYELLHFFKGGLQFLRWVFLRNDNPKKVEAKTEG